MSLKLFDTVPDFTQESTEGPLNFYDWAANSWVVLFSHPRDFTPVCTTELGTVARLKPQFDNRNAKVIALSVDPVDRHLEWSSDIARTQGAALNFPLLADVDRRISSLLGLIHPNASDTVIDPAKRVRLTLTYPASTGRNFDEILRTIDSLQLTDNHKVATPADWKHGDDVIILPSLGEEEARTLFPAGWTEHTPYLRTVAQPGSPG
jgi:thioredoxin-dependent peroxiredoxin